jgi:hypothetical protein
MSTVLRGKSQLSHLFIFLWGKMPRNLQQSDPQGADLPPPTPLPLHVATAGKNQMKEEITASDVAKPYQIWDMQRSYADVNSPYKLNC